MTQLLELAPGEKVLEIGTGSGYQAAVLAQLDCEVYSIEIVEELARSAAALLDELGYERVHVRHGDGYLGWPDEAPFDRIIVTAAPEQIPQPLVEQLRIGGKMVIPVGPAGGVQQLTVLEKRADGEVHTTAVIPVAFVPMVR
jgi:protein-L-isoaspartate(D-aspartate) O-methyltransferase